MRKPIITAVLVLLIAGVACKSSPEEKARAAHLYAEQVEKRSAKEQQNAAEEQRVQAEETARKMREELGDEIESQIGAPFVYISEVSRLKMFVNRKTGILTIIFDCHFFKHAPNILGVVDNMLVRLFDENGQYITDFTTQEEFAEPGGISHEELRRHNEGWGGKHGFPIEVLKTESNVLQYQINLRDAAFIQKGEFGFRPAP